MNFHQINALQYLQIALTLEWQVLSNAFIQQYVNSMRRRMEVTHVIRQDVRVIKNEAIVQGQLMHYCVFCVLLCMDVDVNFSATT